MKRNLKIDQIVKGNLKEQNISIDKNETIKPIELFHLSRRNSSPIIQAKNSNMASTNIINPNINKNHVASLKEIVKDFNSNKSISYPTVFMNNYELLIYLFTESECISYEEAYELLDEFIEFKRFKNLFKSKNYNIVDASSALSKKIGRSRASSLRNINFSKSEYGNSYSSRPIDRGYISPIKQSRINKEELTKKEYKDETYYHNMIELNHINFVLNPQNENELKVEEYLTDNSYVKKEYSNLCSKLQSSSALKFKENYMLVKENMKQSSIKIEIYNSYKTYIYLPLMIKYLKILLLKQGEDNDVGAAFNDINSEDHLDKNKQEFFNLIKTIYSAIKGKNKEFLNDYLLIVNFITKLEDYIFEDIIKSICMKEGESVKYMKTKVIFSKLFYNLKKRKREDKDLLSIIVEKKPIYEKLSNILISLYTKRSKNNYLQEFLAGTEKPLAISGSQINVFFKSFDKILSISNESKTAISAEYRQKFLIKKGNRLSKGVILPYSLFRLIWDMIVIICVVNNVLIIPIYFLWKNYDGIYLSITDITDMIIDGVTYLDIVFSFRTGYVDSSNNIVTDLREIKVNYLKTWFFIDICSTFPWEVLMFGRNTKMLNLFKIPRVLRVNRLIKITEKFNKALVRLILLVIIFFLFAHWTGCICYALLEYSFVLDNMPKPEQKFCMTLNLLGEDDYKEDCKYFFSLFNGMSILNVQSINFPDDDPTKTSSLIFTYLLGQIAFSIIVGLMTSSAKYLDKYGALYNEKLNLIYNQLEFYNIRDPLRKHVTLYFDYLWKKHKETYIKYTSLNHINRILKQKIHLQMHRSLLPKLEFIYFTKCDDYILGDFLANIKITVVLPYEIVFHEGTVSKGLYILDQGCVRIDCQTVNENSEKLEKNEKYEKNEKSDLKSERQEKFDKLKFSFKYPNIKKKNFKSIKSLKSNNSNNIFSSKEYHEDNKFPNQKNDLISNSNPGSEKVSSINLNHNLLAKNLVFPSEKKVETEKINTTNNHMTVQGISSTTTQQQPLIGLHHNSNLFPNIIPINNQAQEESIIERPFNSIFNSQKTKIIQQRTKSTDTHSEKIKKSESLSSEPKDMKPYFDIIALMTKNSRHWCTAYSTEFTELAYIKHKKIMEILKRNEKIFDFFLNEAKTFEQNNELFDNQLIYKNISMVSSRTFWKLYNKGTLEKSDIWLDKEDMYIDEQHDSYEEDKIKKENDRVEGYLHRLADALDEKVNDELKQKFMYNFRKSRLNQGIKVFNNAKIGDNLNIYENIQQGRRATNVNFRIDLKSESSSSSSSRSSYSKTKSNKSNKKLSKFVINQTLSSKSSISILENKSISESKSDESSISSKIKSHSRISDKKSKLSNSSKSLPSAFEEQKNVSL
jgi:hypothetical protein